MKKAFCAIIFIFISILTFTGCSPRDSAGDEPPVFPSIIESKAVIKYKGEEFSALVKCAGDEMALRVILPKNAAGLEFSIDSRQKTVTAGEITVSAAEAGINNDFASEVYAALKSLRSSPTPPERSENAWIFKAFTDTDEYSAAVSDTGILLGVNSLKNDFTAVFTAV